MRINDSTKGAFMGVKRDIVITAYGHDKVIDKIAVSIFDRPKDYNAYTDGSDAKTYCDAINGMELKENSWAYAQIIAENKQYSPDSFSQMDFDIILKLDDLEVQKIAREMDSQVLAMALKGANEPVKEKIFRNISERAAKMVKEDMEYMGNVRISDVKEGQRAIVRIIRHLVDCGEIIINYNEGEMIV